MVLQTILATACARSVPRHRRCGVGVHSPAVAAESANILGGESKGDSNGARVLGGRGLFVPDMQRV